VGEWCVPEGVEPWLQRLVDERARGATLGVERLAAALGEAGAAKGWIARACFEDAVPDGRTVLVAAEGLEVMIAGWSRGRPCAPHDHGPGQGAVRVLQGRARHRGFSLHEGVLRAGADEVLEVGAVLRCPRGVIHQMQDDGDEQPLVTLHLYAGSTVPMTVYDLKHGRTQWLGLGCGAWPRPLGDAEVLRWTDGFTATENVPD
jgi:predicted metal-dependent enzyme (double-stranded beta helix superfamily)